MFCHIKLRSESGRVLGEKSMKLICRGERENGEIPNTEDKFLSITVSIAQTHFSLWV